MKEFLKEVREGVQLFGISLMVNKSKFLIDFENEESGLSVLKEIMDEFYYELDHLFEIRNAVLKNSKYRGQEEQSERIKRNFDNDKNDIFYSKSDQNQFFVRWDWRGVELLDFVHLKIWNYSSEYDLDYVIEKHLPDLEFNYTPCSKQEYENQWERLSYVI